MEDVGLVEDSDRMKVTRDSSFVRVVADNGIATFLGRDVEFALLALSHNVIEIGNVLGTDDADIKNEASFSEVARVRMSPNATLTLALNLMAVLLVSKSLSFEQLEERIATLKLRLVTEMTENNDAA